MVKTSVFKMSDKTLDKLHLLLWPFAVDLSCCSSWFDNDWEYYIFKQSIGKVFLQ